MKAEIEVLQPGLFSSIQDLGRLGFQKFGVPHSGVMDRYAMRICNLILGNSQNCSVMEITMQGPQLKFNDATRICISGANLSPKLNDSSVEMNSSIKISEGDILKFGTRENGFRSYIGIAGGFESESVMESKSWYEGITENARMVKGMKMPYKQVFDKNVSTYSSLKINTEYLASDEIEVYPGPEFENLNTTQKEQLFGSSFKTDQSSNRMAVQFMEDLENELAPIITAPVMPGTVQLTPSGKIICLMRDCQTTGGYPRILQLSEKGIQVLSQKLAGEKVKFKKKEYR
ncbi:biotin-dependent carboxyltransferase family protein [Christiangramia sp. SM2212]|uniref:Biotin-dependent carboxyltransferase family protein n=1 Tax=Christiangramia sediminicola TaxID=3073267 RepID=A0ABU1EQJ4_9FLAO|nr:biotin-dependent carboxyltransferase family protein [Christiangramia sp. SM2212]MDR5590666.1 biotin-dependent carboxyltransferase family protein [Christiangramia sp. SM2212]